MRKVVKSVSSTQIGLANDFELSTHPGQFGEDHSYLDPSYRKAGVLSFQRCPLGASSAKEVPKVSFAERLRADERLNDSKVVVIFTNISAPTVLAACCLSMSRIVLLPDFLEFAVVNS